MPVTETVIRCPQGTLEIEMDGRSFAVYNASVPSAHDLDTVMKSDYFGFEISSTDVQANDEIRVRAADGSFYAVLLVRHVDRPLSKVHTREVFAKEFPIGEASFPDGWWAEYRGTAGEWVLICGQEDREQGLANEDAAAARAWVLSGQDQKAERKKPAPKKRVGNVPKEATAAKKDTVKKEAEAA